MRLRGSSIYKVLSMWEKSHIGLAHQHQHSEEGPVAIIHNVESRLLVGSVEFTVEISRHSGPEAGKQSLFEGSRSRATGT